MSKHPQASHLRLVEPDERGDIDPFAMPIPTPSRTRPPLYIVARRHTDAGTGRTPAREKPS